MARITDFTGMNNAAQSGVTQLLNLDTTPDKKLLPRTGYTAWATIPEAHSLFAGNGCLFCAGRGTALENLFRININGQITEICALPGKGDRLSYVGLPDRVYISSRSGNAIYEYATDSVRQWGEDYAGSPVDLLDGSSSEEMLFHGAIAAPRMENILLHGGRIWGSVGNRVYYSEVLGYELFREDAYIEFPEAVTMVAGINEVTIIGTTGSTYFGTGVDPQEMIWDATGIGAVPGTLQYLPHFQSETNVPIWLDERGVSAWLQGNIIPLTKERLKLSADPGAAGAATLRTINGAAQYLVSAPLPPVEGSAFQDSTSCEVFRNGKLVPLSPI